MAHEHAASGHRRLALLLLMVLVGAWPVAADESAVTDEVRVTGDAEVATDSPGPLLLLLTKPEGQATVTFSYPDAPLDLSAFRDLAIPIKNGTGSELDVSIAATSNPKAAWRHGTTGRWLIRAGEEMDMTALLAREPLPADHPHVKRLGHLFAYPWGHNNHWAAADVSSLRQATVRIAWRNATAGQPIGIGAPRGSGDYSTDPALLEKFELPMVDEFGQARWLDWPGKIHREEELREDGRKDIALAVAAPQAEDQRSRYGGLLGGPKLEATGFFRVEKVDGKWWFVDPEGNLFWSLGVTGAGSGDRTRVKGREDLFPEAFRGEPDVGFYNENLRRKYGTDDWLEQHIDVVVARLRDWGVNTLGAWSKPELLETQRVPYTLIVHNAMARFNSLDKIPDPFSPAFQRSLERSLESLAAKHAKSPWLLGVFIDNELNWTGDNLLVEEIMNSSPGTPAREALVDFLRGRYSDVGALSEAWDKEFTDFAALTPKPGPEGGKAYQKDLDDFLAMFADKYFGLSRDAMDRYFPNHLYLGSRFHVRNPTVRRVASRHCDVLSINIYQHGLEGFSIDMDVDRPWIISEFHFGMRDHGNLGSGLTWAADARNQADVVQAYLSDALRHPNFVGAHWFQWADQVVTGRPDGENFGVGLVTITDRPVKTLNDAMRRVSHELFDFRRGSAAGRIGEGGPVRSSAPSANKP